MALIALALRSLWNRRTTAALTIGAIAISVTLLLSAGLMDDTRTRRSRHHR